MTEFREYLMDNKKWWMIPIMTLVLLLSLLLLATATPLAPFIYTLF